MRAQTYYDTIPRDYFNNIYEQVKEKLVKNENVCVAAMPGCGGRTFLNLFIKLSQEDNLFSDTLYLDFELEGQKINSRLEAFRQKKRDKQIIVFRNIEGLSNKKALLSKLVSMRQPLPDHLVYLFICNETAIIKPEQYFTETSPFFQKIFYIPPFSLDQSEQMIKITSAFYGWPVKQNIYFDIYKLSGGIPRLMKHICEEIAENHAHINNPADFQRDPAILFELKYLNKLLLTLSVKQLTILGLLEDNSKKIKSMLLETYSRKYRSDLIPQFFPQLTNLESKLLTLFLENSGQIVSLDQIGDMAEMNGLDFSLWALYKVISRLKKKVEGKLDIINLKGQGYILERDTIIGSQS